MVVCAALLALCQAQDWPICDTDAMFGLNKPPPRKLHKLCHRPNIANMCPSMVKRYCPDFQLQQPELEQQQQQQDQFDIDPQATQQQQTDAPVQQSNTEPSIGALGQTQGQSVCSDAKCQLLKECCRQQNVASQCMDFCAYNPGSNAVLVCQPNCASEMKKIIYCAANGQDNRQCCLDHGMGTASCLQMCAGQMPPVRKMISFTGRATYADCITRNQIILNCHHSNNPGTKNWHKRKWKQETISPGLRPFLKQMCLTG